MCSRFADPLLPNCGGSGNTGSGCRVEAFNSACSGSVRAAPPMDLGSLDSVAAFADRFERQLGSAPLNALVSPPNCVRTPAKRPSE